MADEKPTSDERTAVRAPTGSLRALEYCCTKGEAPGMCIIAKRAKQAVKMTTRIWHTRS